MEWVKCFLTAILSKAPDHPLTRLYYLTSPLRHNPEDFKTCSSGYLREVLSNAVAWSKRKWKGSIMRPEMTKVKKKAE